MAILLNQNEPYSIAFKVWLTIFSLHSWFLRPVHLFLRLYFCIFVSILVSIEYLCFHRIFIYSDQNYIFLLNSLKHTWLSFSFFLFSFCLFLFSCRNLNIGVFLCLISSFIRCSLPYSIIVSLIIWLGVLRMARDRSLFCVVQ